MCLKRYVSLRKIHFLKNKNILASELRDYKKHLTSMLAKVDSVISDYEKLKSKRFIPISSTIPDDKSAFIQDRVESLTEKTAKQKNASFLSLDPITPQPNATSSSGPQFSPYYTNRSYYGPFNPTVSYFERLS